MAKIKDATLEATEVAEVKVELVEFKVGSTHTIYHKLGSTLFIDGGAEVTEDVATELRDAGIIK